MKKYLLLLTLSLSLFAQNPKSFAALGDVIYNDVAKFENLKEMASMQEFRTAIDAYIASANETKKMGFAMDAQNAEDAKDASVDGKEYLKALRQLSTEHDAIIADSRTRFKEAMSDEDSETINGMLNCGVIDAEDYKDELVRYYEEFGEDQNLSSLDVMYAKHIENQKDDNSTTHSAAQREVRENEALVKRMRATEKAKNDALEKSVKEETARQKKKVLNEQKKELGIE
ncbi:MAG: hypothetical protein WBF77_02210 [Sulfurimonadaceae bacterium]